MLIFIFILLCFCFFLQALTLFELNNKKPEENKTVPRKCKNFILEALKKSKA